MGKPPAAGGQDEERSTLSRIGHAVATGAFLGPAIGVGVAIALVVSSYTPLTFEPSPADASEAQAAPVELPLVDTSEVERSEGPVEGASLDTSSLGIDTSNLKDGTYTGSGTGYSGTITVRVTVSGGKITAIEIVSSADGDPYISNARAVIQRVIDAQSTSVDTVSGATYSSRGILQAIRNALAQASGGQQESLFQPASSTSSNSDTPAAVVIPSVDTSSLKDGTYTGTGLGFQNGTTVIRVTVSGGRITNIEAVSNQDQPVGRDYFNDAFQSIVPRVISSQSVNVDTVSGATYSSRGILQAISSALRQATGGTSQQTTSTNTGDNNGGTNTNTQPSTPTVPTDVDDTIDITKLPDGTYRGTGRGYDDGDTVMSVTISGGRIVKVENVSNEDTEPFWTNAQPLLQRIVDAQSANVDAVSGATYSSRGIKEGVAAALANAQKTQQGETVITVSKATLEAELAKESGVSGDDYTEESWTAYQEALESAKAVDEDSAATQEQVDAAVQALQDAWAALARREEPGPVDDGAKYEDGEYVGYALCGEFNDDGEVSYDLDFSPYYVAVRVTVVDGVPQPVEIVDPAEQDAPVSITNAAHDTDAVLDELSEDDLADNLTYLGYAINGRTRRGTTYQSVLSQIVTYVREHGEAPTLDVVGAQGDLPGEAGVDHIDQVTGATYSSKAIVAAYQDALQQAADAYVEAHPDGEDSSDDDKSGSDTTLEEPSTGGSGQGSTSGSESVEGSGEAAMSRVTHGTKLRGRGVPLAAQRKGAAHA